MADSQTPSTADDPILERVISTIESGDLDWSVLFKTALRRVVDSEPVNLVQTEQMISIGAL